MNIIQITFVCGKICYILWCYGRKFWPILQKSVPLHRVFHSIRFKVNKVGVQRYSFFVFIVV